MSELHYIIELNAREYATLMQIVMRFGTGVEHGGIATSVDLRRKLSEPTYTTVPTPNAPGEVR